MLQYRSLKIIFKSGELQFKSRCFRYTANNKLHVYLLLKSCLNLYKTWGDIGEEPTRKELLTWVREV